MYHITYFDKDSCTGQVSLATDESYTDKTTQAKVENTQWHNVVFYNKMAERVEKYAKKGDLLYVEGRLRPRQYQGQDGLTRYVTEVVALDINFLSPKRSTEGQATPTTTTATAAQAEPTAAAEAALTETGGAPF